MENKLFIWIEKNGIYFLANISFKKSGEKVYYTQMSGIIANHLGDRQTSFYRKSNLGDCSVNHQ